MEWMEAIREAVDYMEAHITEDITTKDVAEHVCISPFYFHKGFSILCGYSPMEYIRNRRLSLAAGELLASDISVMELAMKYGYDSPGETVRGIIPGQFRQGLRPVPRDCSFCGAQGAGDGQDLCSPETDNIVERWLYDGLSDYKEREFYGAGHVP